MSLNPSLGHLYHDGSISSLYTALDVKESLKTREINARETKCLEKYSHVMDRAKSVCRRRNEWEQNRLRQQLRDIGLKTPTLTNSLRLESKRSHESRGLSKVSLPNIHSMPNENIPIMEPRFREEQRPLLVSSWSVYSNRMSRNYSAPAYLSAYDIEKHESYQREQLCTGKVKKGSNYIRKSERVTKTLHRLYTKAVERKFQENQVTVLDVLGKESREELEKALFVLRGTPAGDMIEDILKDKEFVSKRNTESNRSQTTKSYQNKSKKSDSSLTDDSVFITRLIPNTSPKEMQSEYYTELDETSNQLPSLPAVHDVSFAHVPQDSAEKSSSEKLSLKSNSTRNESISNETGSSSVSTSLLQNRWTGNNETGGNDVNEVFKRDDEWMMSSTLANASDIDQAPHVVRWTDLFKTPELWKQTKQKTFGSKKPKHLSLVTLTGKRRRTLMRK